MVEKRSSLTTIECYRTDLRSFSNFLVGLDKRFDPNQVSGWRQVTPAVIDRYIFSLQQKRKLKLATINRGLTVIRGFYSFLVNSGLCLFNPLDGRVLTYPQYQTPNTLSQTDVESLLEQIGKTASPTSKRDLALVTLIYSTGLRNNEVVSLNFDDFVFNEGKVCLKCRGQTGTERLIALDQETRGAVFDYLCDSRPTLAKQTAETALFLSKNGHRLTRAGVWSIIYSCAKEAGFAGKVNPRILRHSFTARMFASGKSRREVQILLDQVTLTSSRTQLLAVSS